ncbi:type II toxin-antitoxin system HicB family antitoxin [Acidithiobacillus ferrianus]|uniref:type II toxin-antitoxin system HicB family antitoxin n=1 Tax=Acidithiobacillus ferrianus TaxID=2678518 RepID=UPI0034E5A261
MKLATLAEIPELPGVMCYGTSLNDAAAKVKSLALRAIADRLDEGEMAASPITIETVERAQACR